MRITSRLLLLAVLLALTACGWRLRGQSAASSLQDVAIYLQAGRGVADVRVLTERSIRVGGGILADSAETADAVLVLMDETIRRRPVSISASARVQEYELGYGLRYRLETPAGEELVAAETIQVSEVYPHDSGNVLSTQSRAATVTQRLRQDAVGLLLPQVRAALAAPAAPTQD